MADYTNTFSELVDKIVDTSKRADKQADIISHIRSAYRKAQCQAYFNQRDMAETQLTPNGADPYIWDPTPSDVRLIRTVLYPTLGIYPPNKPPGRIQADVEEFYYSGPGYTVFKGTLQEDTIDVAYYKYLPSLSYYASGSRPALYDAESQTWSYLLNGSYVPTLGSSTLDAAAQALVTNWLLMNWFEVIEQGALSRLFYALDDPRGPKHLTLFTDGLKDILKGETFETLGV